MVLALLGGAGTMLAGWVVVDAGGELVPFGWLLLGVGAAGVLFGAALRRS